MKNNFRSGLTVAIAILIIVVLSSICGLAHASIRGNNYSDRWNDFLNKYYYQIFSSDNVVSANYSIYQNVHNQKHCLVVFSSGYQFALTSLDCADIMSNK